MNAAARRWADELAGWGIPEEILAAAPESPWIFPVGLFRRYAQEAPRREAPSVRLALEALGAGGSVLDVGCGAGAASAPPASRGAVTRVTGVDSSAEMLVAFAETMERLGVDHDEVEGGWPSIAPAVEPADVVVCGHVVYNVGDLVPFATALDSHARRRVVIEMTDRHPRSWLNPLWRALHGLERPDGPTPDVAAAALREAGIGASLERWEETWDLTDAAPDDFFAFTRRMLCLTPARDAELRAALEANPRPRARGMAALWWDRT